MSQFEKQVQSLKKLEAEVKSLKTTAEVATKVRVDLKLEKEKRVLSQIEKDHCKAIGITEDKFRWFVKQYEKAEKEGQIVPIVFEGKYPTVKLEVIDNKLK